MLYINSSAGLFLGIGLETNVVRLIAAGLDGVPRAHLAVRSSLDLRRAARQIKQGVQKILRECGVDPKLVCHVGIGLPSLIDNNGRIMFAPNLRWTDLKWTDLAIVPELQSVVPAPVHIENNANAAALAEQRFGICRGISDFVLIHGHSGIGGSLYLSDDLYRGSGGLAGELGHIKVVPRGRPCSCGGHGCLEAYVSEKAICARVLELGRNVKDVSDIAEAAAQGDKIVLKVLGEAGEHLGFALANITNVVDVHFIVLGGDLASLAEYLLPSLKKTFIDNVLPIVGSEIKFLVSALGRDAVAFGGIALAMDAFLPYYRIGSGVPVQPAVRTARICG
jgi:predicted NBD/HSP70 family sugar kinase